MRDYPYFHLFVTSFMFETRKMSQEQKGDYIDSLIGAWVERDLSSMPSWMSEQVDKISDISAKRSESAKKRYLKKEEQSQEPEPQPPKIRQERPKKEPIDTADFERFWASYPKRVDKKGALRSWQKESPDIELVIRAIESQKANWTDPQFIPMPTTWLNQRRFEAQIDAISKPPEEEEDRITMWKRHFGMPL